MENLHKSHSAKTLSQLSIPKLATARKDAPQHPHFLKKNSILHNKPTKIDNTDKLKKTTTALFPKNLQPLPDHSSTAVKSKISESVGLALGQPILMPVVDSCLKVDAIWSGQSLKNVQKGLEDVELEKSLAAFHSTHKYVEIDNCSGNTVSIKRIQ